MTFTYRPPSLLNLPHEQLAQEADKAIARIYEAFGDLHDEVGRFGDADVPTPVPDGTNKIFTLAHAPDPQASLRVYVNLALVTAYTLSGAIITFSVAPAAAAAIVTWYRWKQ